MNDASMPQRKMAGDELDREQEQHAVVGSGRILVKT
jgi:hypothetical protein